MTMKAIRVAALTSVLSLVGLPDNSMADEPFVHWDFNSTADGKVLDAAGDAHAEIHGAAAKDQLLEPGLYGNAIVITPGEYWLEIPAEKSPGLREDFSIRAVCKPYQVHGYRALIWKGDRTAVPDAVNYYLGIRDGRVEFKYKDAEGHWIVFTAQRTVKENEWLDIQAYHSGEDMEMWINGRQTPVIKSSEGDVDWRLVENDFPCWIGVGRNSRSGEQDCWFYGLIDELTIYQGNVIDRNIRPELLERMADYENRMAEQERERTLEQEKRREQEQKNYCGFYDRYGKGLPFMVRVQPVSMRVEKTGDVAAAMQGKGEEIVLQAAGNEVESVQLLIAASPERDVSQLTVKFSPLKSVGGEEFPVENMAWGKIASVTTERPGIAVPFVGDIPDVVQIGSGAVNVGKGDFVPVLIRYSVPENLPAGLYQGSLVVADGAVEFPVAVRLKVAGFSLPKRGTLKIAFSFFEDTYRKWYGKQALSPEEKMGIYEFLLSYRLSPSNLYHKELEMYPDAETLAKIRDRVNFFTLRNWGHQVVEPEEVKQRVERYRRSLEKAAELGMEDFAYFYGVDELSQNMERLEGAKQAHDVLSTHFPTLKMMQTSSPIPELRNLFNVWVPLVDSFGNPEEMEKFDEVRKKGDSLWWYLADSPLHPFPNFFLDYPVFDSRVLGILSWKYEVDGLLYWAINREWVTNMDIRENWPEAAWRPYIERLGTGPRKARNGMGNLIYPGPNGQIYPSLRLENLRDGIEDYEYVAILKRKIETLEKRGDADGEMLKKAKVLLDVPDEVARAANDYNADPGPLMKYRNAVAQMIERLKGEEL